MQPEKPRFHTRKEAMVWMAGYYKSEHWIIMSRKVRQLHPICQECRVNKATEVHHRNYDRLYHERPSDLTAICHQCHEEIEARKKRTRELAAKMRNSTNKKSAYARRMLNLRKGLNLNVSV